MDGRIEPKTSDGDIDGLDDSQRAEVHEYEGGGPTDGLVLTDMARDRGEDFVEDERPSELVPEEVDAIGMSILTDDALDEEGLGDDLDEEADDEL